MIGLGLTASARRPHAAAGLAMRGARNAPAFARHAVIALAAMLTTADLFAVQAVLPALAAAYGVSAAAMGTAANAATLGMAVGSLAMAVMGRAVDRRRGVLASLVLLAIPTVALSVAPSLWAFAALRIVQGLFMSAAFTLTLAHLGEQRAGDDTAAAFAAYITGNVASNLFGRLVSAFASDQFGLAVSFQIFAALNLAGAALVFFTLKGHRTVVPPSNGGADAAARRAWLDPLRDRALLNAFAAGFCILFAFIGTFTYVNFELVRQPFSLGMMAVGLVYFVFVPSIATTPLAGRVAARFGIRRALWISLAIALLGLTLTVWPVLASVLTGLVLIGVGTFLAQAVATGFVGRAAANPGAASGLYLAFYFLGGLSGAFVCGHAYTQFGWPGCAAMIALALAVAAQTASRMKIPSKASQPGHEGESHARNRLDDRSRRP
jgi:MFS transporter, YNFM family, putative membrane transport protein